MIKVRIIPVLLLRGGRMVKGKQFSDFRDTGDPVYASRVYNSQYVDELIFLDIDATNEGREPDSEIIEKVSKECFMPLTIGGGISKIEHIRKMLNAGADKVVINSAAIDNPKLIKEASEKYGSQCIIVGIDVKKENEKYIIYKNSGKTRIETDLLVHIENIQKSGAGEIFINSINNDGMMQGYDLELVNYVIAHTKIPVIACGGAGNLMHLVDGFKKTNVSALAMASIYHFGDNNPIRARAYLKNHNIPIKVV
jgi:imidazole glycerol-phosphate synthase subunit HisF